MRGNFESGQARTTLKMLKTMEDDLAMMKDDHVYINSGGLDDFKVMMNLGNFSVVSRKFKLYTAHSLIPRYIITQKSRIIPSAFYTILVALDVASQIKST